MPPRQPDRTPGATRLTGAILAGGFSRRLKPPARMAPVSREAPGSLFCSLGGITDIRGDPG